MSTDKSDWVDELSDDLGVDPGGVELVKRTVKRMEEEGEIGEDGLLSRLSRRDVLTAGAGTLAGAGLLGSSNTAAAAPSYGNATGQSGTEARPLSRVISQEVTTEQLGADSIQSQSINTEEYHTILTPEPGTDLSSLSLGDYTTVLLAPNGSYTLSSSLPEHNSLRIEAKEGAGIPQALPTIEYTGSTGAGTRVVDWGSTDPVARSEIKNVTFDGGGAETGFYARYMINRSHLQNVHFTNLTGDAFDISEAYYSWLDGCAARDSIGGRGLYIHETDGQVNNFVVDKFQAANTSGFGARVDANMIGISNSYFENGSAGGLDVSSSGIVYLETPYFENNGGTEDLNIDCETAIVVAPRTKRDSDVGVRVASGTSGAIFGGQYLRLDASNQPDTHIVSNSDYFDVWYPGFSSGTTSDPRFDLDGYLHSWDSSFLNEQATHRGDPKDLSTVTGRENGEKMVDDGTNTTSGNPETFAWVDSDDTWYSASGDSIVP